jgi:hypothetical protein
MGEGTKHKIYTQLVYILALESPKRQIIVFLFFKTKKKKEMRQGRNNSTEKRRGKVHFIKCNDPRSTLGRAKDARCPKKRSKQKWIKNSSSSKGVSYYSGMISALMFAVYKNTCWLLLIFIFVWNSIFRELHSISWWMERVGSVHLLFWKRRKLRLRRNNNNMRRSKKKEKKKRDFGLRSLLFRLMACTQRSWD